MLILVWNANYIIIQMFKNVFLATIIVKIALLLYVMFVILVIFQMVLNAVHVVINVLPVYHWIHVLNANKDII